MNDIKRLLSVIAIVIAGGSAFYSKRQGDISEESYSAAKEQLVLANKELAISEQSYKTAKEQLDLQKQILALDNQYSVVMNIETDESLRQPMSNGKKINLVYHNNSKRPYIYKVLIKSGGFGVFWSDYTPDKLVFGIYLDHLQIVVPPGDRYYGSFAVWLPKIPSTEAMLQIYINGDLERSYSYSYDKKQNIYIYKETQT